MKSFDHWMKAEYFPDFSINYKVSISSTFYKRLFVQKFFLQLVSKYSLALQFFGKRISAKKAFLKN